MAVLCDLNMDYENFWLTQTPKLDEEEAKFDITTGFIEEEMFSDEKLVSLEEVESPRKRKLLYDQVEVEDISSDEGIDNM